MEMGSECLQRGEDRMIKIKKKETIRLKFHKIQGDREERVMKRKKWDQYGEERQRESLKDCPSSNCGKCQRNMSTL